MRMREGLDPVGVQTDQRTENEERQQAPFDREEQVV